MGDMKGARQDRQLAERKIAEHKSRLKDSTYSIYPDTTQKFDKLLSFDAKLQNKNWESAVDNATGHNADIKLMPLFKFTLMKADSAMKARDMIYYAQRMEDFKQKISNHSLTISNKESNISPDSLI